jgi:aspartyl-tRNA synthetase
MEEITKETSEILLDSEGKPLSKNALKKLQKEQEKLRKKADKQAETAVSNSTEDSAQDFSEGSYGVLPLNQSQTRPKKARTLIDSIPSMVGNVILVKARVHNSRGKGKQCFMVLRQQKSTVQAVLAVDKDTISKQMVKFASGHL